MLYDDSLAYPEDEDGRPMWACFNRGEVTILVVSFQFVPKDRSPPFRHAFQTLGDNRDAHPPF